MLRMLKVFSRKRPRTSVLPYSSPIWMTRDLRLPIRSSETPASVVLAAGGLLSCAFLRIRPNQPASHSGDSRPPWSGPDPLLCNEELEDSKSHLAENDTFNFRQSFKMHLSSSIKILPDILTGYAASEIRQNTCPLLVHLLVRFSRSFRSNVAEIMKILSLEGEHETDRYFRKAQARK